MKRTLYSIILSLAGLTCFSQEGLKPLSSNFNYYYEDLQPSVKAEVNSPAQQKTQAIGSYLPFVEDFYYSSTSYYPDANKWSDSSVYINSGFATAPPSIGVATFDGLNKHGYPYDPLLINQTISKPADVLTSRPINLYTASNQATLDPQSDVALSFYYQARGKGDNPESSDSLIVDFYKPLTNKWVNAVWHAKGNSNSNTNDSVFKRAFIKIKDSAYFHDGFKFRFRNWASPTGDFDHWHVDYIFLDRGRGNDSLIDTARNDISFGGIPTPFLKKYSAMPFEQFTNSEIAQKFSVRIKSHAAAPKNIGYSYKVYDKNGTQLGSDYSGGFANINPFYPNGGYLTAPALSNPTINAAVFPTLTDSTDYTIKHYVYFNQTAGTDILNENDTVIQHLRLRNYYAFDDGGAEAGYYVNAIGGVMAVKIELNVADVMRAVRIYFDPAGNVDKIPKETSTDYYFSINVWMEAPGGGPGNLVYSEVKPLRRIEYYKEGFKLVPEYRLNAPMGMSPGTYYVGIKQTITPLVVGFDRNYNFGSSVYFDSGSGWMQSQLTGAVMIRPVFGDSIPSPVGLKEYSELKRDLFLIYPNPSAEQFVISSLDAEKNAASSYQLLNSLGQVVQENTIESREQVVYTSALNSGIYILILKQKGIAVQQQKIIIQH